MIIGSVQLEVQQFLLDRVLTYPIILFNIYLILSLHILFESQRDLDSSAEFHIYSVNDGGCKPNILAQGTFIFCFFQQKLKHTEILTI